MFRFKIKGLDEVQRKLRDLERKAKDLHGEHSVPLSELFSPSFISKYTRFSSLDEMFEASPFKIETQEDFDAVPREKLDEFIQSESGFSGWSEMLQEATKAWAANRLGFE